MSELDIFRNSRVLITGHTGFKGSWLALWLKYLGAEVHGISESIPTDPSHFSVARIEERIIDWRVDVRNESALTTTIQEIRPDFVFHLAAQALVRKSYVSPHETFSVNTLGTINVLSAIREIAKPVIAIMITSDKVYDNVEWPWGYRETDLLGGKDPYSASKAAAELAIRSYSKSFFPHDGLVRIGVGRAGNVIGGGDWAEDRIVPDSVRAWSLGEKVQLRSPQATRPWQHVLEPLSGYLALAAALKQDARLHAESFNFGPPSQQNQSVEGLVEEMAKYWDLVRWEDISSQYGGPYESGLLKLDCDKALHHLRWRAVWNFEETVRETVLWYRNHYEQSSGSMVDFSLNQISDYMQAAQSRGVAWAE